MTSPLIDGRALRATAAPAAVSVVVPTRNEAGNIRELLNRIARVLPEHSPHEVLFVDDSTDDTPDVVRSAAHDHPFPIRLLHRDRPDGGLGGAVVEGLRAATGDWVVVMDGDLQHPPELVPHLVGRGREDGADLVVASRYARGGSRAGLAGGYRLLVSGVSTLLSKSLFPRRLSGVSDPMSGFFAVRRDAVAGTLAGEGLKPLGYKILLELVVRCRPRALATVAEVPFTFRARYTGQSKSTAREGLRFLQHLAGLRTGTALSRMVVFGLIGLTGFLPNLAALWLLTRSGLHYLPAEVLANQAGVAWNLLLTELLLFHRERAHRHWADRWARFALLANADLLLRIPLIALLVAGLGLAVLPATALALIATFVLRFAATQALIYVPRTRRPPVRGDGGKDHS
ncbi:glycosyltransferase family 2 protein [Streptomyces sp. MUM 203J]|uniref:glycosyltransferase n=1 Tax=Streptomyces sp. MUM 203J TaxID=2791990 RepID=UPI001F039B78|nr:glycosyltransferase [Streptomyces sp. MUM 203J]MCH0541095.1 glycosyltransferase family 2 protein [Streptomyces sp. MUM 203J]